LIVAAAGMLAKQRGQGKRGNILLAMPQARFSMACRFHAAESDLDAAGPVRGYG
jgi:hypothetical protein